MMSRKRQLVCGEYSPRKRIRLLQKAAGSDRAIRQSLINSNVEEKYRLFSTGSTTLFHSPNIDLRAGATNSLSTNVMRPWSRVLNPPARPLLSVEHT